MQISGNTTIYGIMGHPVSHSLSPAMHNAAFKACGLDKVYVAFDVVDVPRALDGFRALGVGGVSVTIPHKQAVIAHLDDLDPVAEKIGAVNTLVIEGHRICGSNTDWIGASRALETIVTLQGSRVLVVGAGGSARAIGFGLKEKGATVVIANRTVAKGEALAEALACEFIPLSEMGHASADVLVNATSIGMVPMPDATPAPRALLERIPAVMDAVYSPLRTRLLVEAEQAGCKTVDGTQMLLYQGVAQFELWTGLTAPVAVMRAQLISRLASG